MRRARSEMFSIRPAAPEERAQGFALVFQQLPTGQREQRTADALARVALTDGLASGLWVARRAQQLVGAVYATIQPGKTAMVTLPCLARGEPFATAGDLVGAATAYLEHQGVRLAQALLEEQDAPSANAFVINDFRHACDLLYLVSPRDSFPAAPPSDGLEFVAYRTENYDRFAAIVEQTYEGSLDCPVIDKVRAVDDVLAGYRATGVFDPARWLIVRRDSLEVGCLLMTHGADFDQWELLYMGAVRSARGRGIGTAMVRHAQWMARQAGCERMSLAVDAANAPAIAVYRAAGFVTWCRRSVLLRVF